jgi:hypothetical protein
MAPQAAPPPPAKGMSPQDYYGALTSQGFRPWEAYQAVQANFGPPKSPQEQAEELASAEQNAALAQTGGQVLGAVGTAYGLGQLGAGAGAGTGAVAMPTALGGSGALGGTAGTTSIGSVALPVAAIAAGLSETWEGGMKDIIRGRGNKQDWTNMGINAVGGVGPNLVLRWMGKPSLGRMMTSGKSDAQLLRDDFRGKLKETGIADEDYNITLANGDKYNIGKDGKAKLTNIDGKTTRRTWDVDWENPLAKYAVDKLDPRVRSIYTEEAAKAGIPVEQYTGMLVNAATYNAKSEKDVEANIDAMLGKSGLDKGAGATVSTRPAPVPSGAPTGPIPAPQASVPEQPKKLSFWDMLKSRMD